MRQIVIQEKKDEDGEKYLTVDSEDDWHEALRRGRWIETPLQLAEQIGVPMNEDVGTLADINAAGAGWGRPPFPSPLGKFGSDYARRVSDDLIEQIKQGVAPWQQPWPPGERVAPENFSSGKKYTGGNSVYLMSRSIQQGFGGDNCWGTYRQIEAAGGHVRKGEKGTRVLFWTQQKARPMTRQYTVFNVHQADGLDLPPRWGQPPPEWATHGEAEKVIEVSGPTVEHVHGDRAYYRVAEDKVALPKHDQFPTRNGYYQMSLRETPPPARRGFTVADQVNQLVGASEADHDLGFMGRTMALCSLLRSNLGNRLQYKRQNGPFTLYMTASGGNKLPFGNLPRLLLAWVSTEAVRTQSREISLGRSLSEFMRALGVYSSSGGKYTRLRNQMKRLFGCTVSMTYEDKHGDQFVSSLIAERGEFWWNECKPDEPMLWNSKILFR